MAKINWKVRLRHPAFYTALAALIGMIVTDAELIDAGKYEMYVQLVLGVLVAGGVVVDMTTAGVKDSKQALTYDKPKKDGKTHGENEFY